MKENAFHSLDETLREQLHQCLEAHAPELQQRLLEGLGIAQEDIGRLRADWANRAGIGPDFESLHMVRPLLLEYEARADEVFRLLCPVRENEWIPGWQEACKVLHTDSGIAEEGCVFTTYYPDEGRAVWLCSDYDPAAYRIEYIKHIEGKAIAKWQMRVEPLGPRRCVLISRFEMTALSEVGKRHVLNFFADRHDELLEGIRTKIVYFLQTGQMRRV